MDNRVGQRLGNYRLTHLIGQGGFSDVYLGEHIYLGTQAAIKVLQTRLVGHGLEQFRGEAQTIAKLVHPHIVRILDFGVDDGVPFLVMDYAPNGTLRQRHPRGTPVATAYVVSYVRQVGAALQYAHDRKLIHRDIKPENMLLSTTGDVLLSDFGLVLIAQSTGSQSTQEVAGTIPYMAPEQIHGKPRPASDQYALGIVIYEWLSGERPFNGSFVEIATQHLMTPPAPLYGRIPGVSKAVEEVVFTALAKDPQRRFANIWAFATALAQAHEGMQTYTPVPPPVAASLDQSAQSTYVATPPDQSVQPTLLTPATGQSTPSIYSTHISDQSAQSTFVVTPSSGPAQPDDLTTLPRQSFQPPPYPQVITSSNQTSWPTEVAPRRNQVSQNTRPAPPANPPSSPGLSTPSTAAFSQMSTLPVQPNQWSGPASPAHVQSNAPSGAPISAAGIQNNIIPSAIATSNPPRKRRSLPLIIALLALALLLIGATVLAIPLIRGSGHGQQGQQGGGAGSAGGAGSGQRTVSAGTASITITPASQDLKNTFTISAVTGTPDPAQQQVGARVLSSTTQAQSQTVKATGTKQIPGVKASGTLVTGCRATDTPLPIPAGSIFTGNDNVQVSTDIAVTLSSTNCVVNIPAHAVQPGTGGNVVANDINQPYNGYTIDNPAPFSGGQDPQNVTVVQQSDIDGAANTLEANPPDAQQTLQGQVHTNERFVGTPRCAPGVTSNYNAGDQATSVTVTVSFTCTGEVYDYDGALSMATQLLNTQAATNPGSAYTLTGKITTALAQATLADANTGTVSLAVNAGGIWVFQFSDAQKQDLAKLIAGKSRQEAQSLLSAQQGVGSASIQLSGGDGNTLPADPTQISIVVGNVPGT